MKYPTYKLGDILSYEQPTNYIVESTEYDGSYPTPVLTAGKSFILGYTNETKGVYDKLPVIIFDDFTTASQFVDFKFKVKSSAMKILSCNEEIADIKYMYYLMQITHIQSDTHKRYWISDYSKIPVSLPPLTTQRAIVSRIESLFAELDKAEEHLRTAQQQLKIYRQAVLRDAFEGYKEMKTVLELSTIVTSGSRGWAKYYTEKKGARFVRITDLTRDKIVLQNKNIQYISLPSNAEGKRSLLQPNDVLVSITADLGSIALVPQNIGEAYINQHIAMIRFKNTRLGKFMAYYLKSDFGQKELLKNKRGNGKLGLGLDDIRNTYIPFVAEEDAIEIVNKIESRLSQATASETYIENALQQAEALRQSILKKAFSGELV